MNTPLCEQLDDYLVDSLSKSQRRAFEDHLVQCQDCQRQIERQRRIDGLLAQGSSGLEPVPPSLFHSFERQLRLNRRRALRLAWGLSAAATVLLLVGIWAINRRMPAPLVDGTKGTDQIAENLMPPSPVAARSNQPVRVTLADPSAAILLPVETETPNVSIVWVYPTYRPARPGDEDVSN
jgi:anti-sigma factor RsiW